MAVSKAAPPNEVPPILLNIWQNVMLENEWLFNQITGAGTQPVGCEVYIQPDRDILARALYTAYSKIRECLNYDLMPAWHTERISLGRGFPYQLQGLTTRFGYLKAFGAKTTAVIQAAAPVVYSDEDGDGTDDTATITVVTGVANDEVHVFFQVSDGALNAADARYEIFPVVKSDSAGTVTITAPRAYFAKPATIWNVSWTDPNGRTKNAGNTANVADFVTAVDIYRVYANPAAQVTLIADPFQRRCCNIGNLDTDQTMDAVAWIEDPQAGIFSVRIDSCSSCWRYHPQYAYVQYQAGAELQYDTMDGELAEGMAHLANVLLPRVICQTCHAANNSFIEDRGLYINEGNEKVPVYTQQTPYGVAIGAQRAWLMTLSRKLGRGMKLTRNKAW